MKYNLIYFYFDSSNKYRTFALEIKATMLR